MTIQSEVYRVKPLDDWQVRVIEERYDLSERLGRLLKFVAIKGPEYLSLTIEDQKLLDEQAKAMRRYVRVLDKRIASFNA